LTAVYTQARYIIIHINAIKLAHSSLTVKPNHGTIMVELPGIAMVCLPLIRIWP
jgi:hypothetical protein